MAEGIKVKFSATDSGFSGTVAKVNQSLKGVDSNTKGVASGVKSSFAAMAAAGAALASGFAAINIAARAVRGTLDNFGEALDMGGKLAELSERTGETAGNLMLLNRAFDNTGVGSEKVGTSLNKLQRSIIQASEGAKIQQAAFKELGLSVEQLEYMAPIDQLRAVAQALEGVANDSQRTKIAMDIFGRSGGELLPLLRNFASETSEAKAELGSLPEIMDRSASAFDRVSDKLAVTKGKLTEFAAGLLESAIPALNQFVTAGSQLDAAGFGSTIGSKLSEAFSLIMSGDMWEIFKLKGIAAINAIQSSGAINNLAAGILTVWDGVTDGKNFNFDETFKKYQGYGIEANTEIADALDARIDEIMERQRNSMREAARQMEQEAAVRAAESGIMLKDIKPKADSTNILPDWLKRGPEASEKIKDDSRKIADNFARIAPEMQKAASYADQAWNRINQAKAQDKIDPGGRTNARINEALGKGQFEVAERLGNRLDRAEQDARIQKEFGRRDEVGGASSIKKSLQDIAKEQGLDTKGKGSKELRRELDELAKRKEEMRSDKNGKTKAEIEKGGVNKPDTIMSDLKAAVEEIKKTILKIEPKLPTAALGA